MAWPIRQYCLVLRKHKIITDAIPGTVYMVRYRLRHVSGTTILWLGSQKPKKGSKGRPKEHARLAPRQTTEEIDHCPCI